MADGGAPGAWTDNFRFSKVFGVDNQNQTVSRAYVIRNKELEKVLGVNYSGMEGIQQNSKAIISVATDDVSEQRFQSYIQFRGAEKEVKKAEEDVCESVQRTYGKDVFPEIMVPLKCFTIVETRIPDDMVVPLLFSWELYFYCWMKIDDCPSRGGRILTIYGTTGRVMAAMEVLNKPFPKSLMSLSLQHGEASNLVDDGPKWTDLFGDGQREENLPESDEEVESFFKGLCDKSYSTMIGICLGYIALTSSTNIIEKNPNDHLIARTLTLIGYVCALLAVILEKGKIFRSLVCAAIALETCLIFIGATFYGMPKYSAVIGIFGGLVAGISVFYKSGLFKGK